MYTPSVFLLLFASRPAPTMSSSEMSSSCQDRQKPALTRGVRDTEAGLVRPRVPEGEVPTFTPLSFRRGVLEGGMGVRFPAGLKTLGVVGLLKGACFGMPLSGAAKTWGPQGLACLLPLSCFPLRSEATLPAHRPLHRPRDTMREPSGCNPIPTDRRVSARVGGGDVTSTPATPGNPLLVAKGSGVESEGKATGSNDITANLGYCCQNTNKNRHRVCSHPS